MMPRSKLALWIVILSALSSVIWTFCFPYAEQRLYAAVPSDSSFVSAHDCLGERWDGLLAGGAGDVAASLLGMEQASDLKSRAVSSALRCFAGKKTLFAYVPPRYEARRGSWVAVSWAGGASQLIRWNLVHPFVKGLKKDTMPNGLACWVYGSGHAKVIFTFRDGYMLAVKGDDIGLLRRMSSRLDSHSRGDISINGQRLKLAAKSYPGKADLAWYLTPFTVSADGSCLIALEPRDDGIRLHGSFNKTLPFAGSAAGAALDAASVCGDHVDAIAVSKWANLSAILGKGSATNPVVSFLNDVSVDEANMFVGVMSDRFSGKMYNLKVPVMLAGVQVKPGVDINEGVNKLMDRLNAEKGLGIIPVKMPTEKGPIILAGGSKMNLFGDTRERPALTVRDGWLVVCSDMESLLHVLQEWDASDPVESPRWSEMLDSEGGEIGAYVDFTASELSIRNAIAVYTLFLIAEGDGTAEKRAGLDVLRNIVERMADVGAVVASSSSSEGVLRISLLLGSEEGL